MADKLNRPYKIMKRNIEKSNSEPDVLIHQDDDSTHYVEIGVSKDKKFFIYTDGNGAATVIDRTKTPQNDEQIVLVKGGESKRVFVDHIRVSIKYLIHF